jgi:hypothetical protein
MGDTGEQGERARAGGRLGAPTVTALDDSACLALLSRAHIGRVALCVDAMPTIRAVRFAVDGDAIVIRVRPDSRLQRATAGTVVAFETDHYDLSARNGWTVEVCGVASVVTDPVELVRLSALPLEPWTTPDTDTFVSIASTVIRGETVQLGSGTVVDLNGESVTASD